MTSIEIEGASVVLIGNFNPSIFQPAWLAANELIGKQESEKAKIDAIHSDLCVFTTEWLQLQVTTDRFTATTLNQAFYNVLRDLVHGIFTLLEHTPARAMGLNRRTHFHMGSRERRDKLGFLLAPQSPWEGIVTDSTLSSLLVRGARVGGRGKWFSARVEPSRRILPADSGVYVETNEHYEGTLPELMKSLSEDWESVQTYGAAVTEKLIALVPS